MNGAAGFLTTVREREGALIDAIFAGAKAPFPEPVSYTHLTLPTSDLV